MSVDDVLAGRARWHVLAGDCLALDLPEASVDAVVTDPPAGIGFMGKAWDHDRGGRAEWCAWLAERLRVAFRALKPGGHAVIWALPRTSHWTATAVEDAGFEVRDVLTHHFGSGFPKSLDVGKAIDAMAGAVRQVVGPSPFSGRESARDLGVINDDGWAAGAPRIVTAPATPEAAQWDGWGTALKPGSEHWILARKPLAGTVARNVLAHGTGALNVGVCRVGVGEPIPTFSASHSDRFIDRSDDVKIARTGEARTDGRWPANVAFTHSAACVSRGRAMIKGTNAPGCKLHASALGRMNNDGWRPTARAVGRYVDGDGLEEVEACSCAPDCPVAELDRQSGERRSGGDIGTAKQGFAGNSYAGGGAGLGGYVGYADTGGASRFFPTFRYVPKAPRKMREDGLQAPEGERGNDHPTVKHDNLMRWLVRLVTPPSGVVLDLFAGSGSTGRAALQERMRFIGVDIDPHNVEIARARIAAVDHRQRDLFAPLAEAAE